jgi:hypothetical protein
MGHIDLKKAKHIGKKERRLPGAYGMTQDSLSEGSPKKRNPKR